MAVDNIFGEDETKETPAPSKSKKRAASSSKVCFVCTGSEPSLIYREHEFEQCTTKNKRAETVSIPYAAVPGMDTNSREFRKAIVVENAKAGNTSGKRARTEPPFIGSLADLQSVQSSYFINLFVFFLN